MEWGDVAARVSVILFTRTLYAMAWLAVLLVSVPIFMASVVVVVRSDGPVWMRTLLSGWVLGIPVYFGGVYWLEFRAVRTEVYLIPEGYRGRVVSRFGSGAAEEWEGEKLVLRVGADGRASTRARVRWFSNREVNERRASRREYYLVDGVGNRRRVSVDLGGESWGALSLLSGKSAIAGFTGSKASTVAKAMADKPRGI